MIITHRTIFPYFEMARQAPSIMIVCDLPAIAGDILEVQEFYQKRDGEFDSTGKSFEREIIAVQHLPEADAMMLELATPGIGSAN